MAILRPFRLAAQLAARDLIRAPRELARGARTAAAAFLDDGFTRDAPIPFLHERHARDILSIEVTVPPLRHFDRGNQSLAGLCFIVSLAAFLGAKEIFEIGTYNGLTAATLARNLAVNVHTLDIPANVPPALSLFTGDELHIGATREYADVSHRRGSVDFLTGDSAEFDFSPYRGRCDLVFIDGSHSRDYVESDTRNGFRLLRTTGAIVWDDYARGMPGVTQALDSLVERYPLVRIRDTRLVAYIPALTEGTRG